MPHLINALACEGKEEKGLLHFGSELSLKSTMRRHIRAGWGDSMGRLLMAVCGMQFVLMHQGLRVLESSQCSVH